LFCWCITLTLALLLAAPLAVNAQPTQSFQGSWSSNVDCGFTRLDLVQKGALLTGTYSTSPYPDLRRIQGGEIRGMIVGNRARVKITSSFAASDREKGIVDLTVVGKKITWHEIKSPGSGEDYSPDKVALTKVDLAKEKAIAKDIAAGEELFKAAKNLYEAERLMRPVLSLRPRDFYAETDYATLLIDLYRANEAIKRLRDIDENDGDDRAPFALASAYEMLHRYVEAESTLQKCLERNSLDATTWMRLSAVQRKQNKVNLALRSAEKVVSLDPKNRAGFVNLGDINMFNGNFDKASAAFQQWSAASDGKIHFLFVDSKYLANITCKWTDNFAEAEAETEADGANTNMFVADGSSLWANIYILTRTHDSNSVTNACMHHTCLHEIGHAIGLVKHSPVHTDVMFAFEENEPSTERSKRDILTIRRLYPDVESPDSKITKDTTSTAPLSAKESKI
jgi:Flp pilus assembly protein TadD